MGTSFVGIGDKGFWMRDGVLELWLRLLSLHIKDPTESNTLNTKIRDQWLLASRGFFNGCVPTALDEAVSTEEGRAVVVNAIRSLMKVLSEAPDTLDKGVLNVLGISGTWTKDFEVASLIEVGEAFLDLIDGKIQTDPSDTSFMPGCRIET